MNNIISFSGGKDSTALVLWAKEHLSDFRIVFCDTGWEDPITYQYLDYIQDQMQMEIIKIKSEKYEGMLDLVETKGRFPSTTRRFCTEELKLKPMQTYLQTLAGEKTLFLGVRADESRSRSKLPEGRIFDDDYYQCWIDRPLLRWTADQCFELMKTHNIEPNPLYKMGMKRVGCMPCIMVNHNEMKAIIRNRPEIIEKLSEAERTVGRTFFPPAYIPERFMTGFDEKTNTRIPKLDDVVAYLQDDRNQLEMFEMPSCMSYYSICE